jgi:hypothetical protein
MEGVVRTVYRFELNRIYYEHHRALSFLAEHGGSAISAFLEAHLRGVKCKDGDAVLQLFLAEGVNLLKLLNGLELKLETDINLLDVGSFSFVVSPMRGEIEQYHLNSASFFFSNAHQNTDPIITNHINRDIRLCPEEKRGIVRMPGRKKVYAPNVVSGGVFFKKPVESYPGFKDYFNYHGLDLKIWA